MNISQRGDHLGERDAPGLPRPGEAAGVWAREPVLMAGGKQK